MCYKTVRDEHGVLVRYSKLFAVHADDDLEGMAFHPSIAEDICDVASCYLNNLTQAKEPYLNAHIMAQIHECTWANQAKGRLSPAWLRLYQGKS